MSVVVFFVEILEGNDQPTERGKPYFEADCGATGGLIMHTKKPMFGTGKTEVMDSGFCVMKELVGMLAHGVYGTTVIKKKRYCTKYCKGDAIEAFFQDKDVGGVYGVFGDIYGHKYKIHCMNESNYVMKLFSTHG